MRFAIIITLSLLSAFTTALPSLERRLPHEYGQEVANPNAQANANGMNAANVNSAANSTAAAEKKKEDSKKASAEEKKKKKQEKKKKKEEAKKKKEAEKKNKEKDKNKTAAVANGNNQNATENAAGNNATENAAGNNATENAAGNNAAGNNAGAENLQPFKGALAGIAATPVENSGDAKRPFQVKGDTFVNKAAALQRSCDQQFNACANAANAKTANIAVSDCEQQKGQCNAADK